MNLPSRELSGLVGCASEAQVPGRLSGVDIVRAATRYLLQYDSWHTDDPPRITRSSPISRPRGDGDYDRRIAVVTTHQT